MLAFANLSHDPENEYFSDGITEELLNVLANVPGLRVAARTSAFYFKGKSVPIRQIANELGVAYVVEGSVRKAGNRVRITAQLIKAADGFHVWSGTYDRELKDIFALQDEMASVIAENLQLQFGQPVRATRVVNPEAHRLVLEGRHFWMQRTEAGFASAEKAYNEALAIDPEFAAAHTGLANVWAIRAWYRQLNGIVNVERDLQTAKHHVQRALALDPTAAEPHAALAAALWSEGHTMEADAEIREALRLVPNHAVERHWYGHILSGQGRLDEAIEQLERSVQLDPLSFITLVHYSYHLYYAGRIEESLRVMDRADALASGLFAPIQSGRPPVLLALGRKQEAAELARKILRDQYVTNRWWGDCDAVYVLNEVGASVEAAAHAEQLHSKFPADSYQHGYLLSALARFDEAWPFLERAPVSVHVRLFWYPMWDPVREHPRFLALLDKLNCRGTYEVALATRARMNPAGRGGTIPAAGVLP